MKLYTDLYKSYYSKNNYFPTTIDDFVDTTVCPFNESQEHFPKWEEIKTALVQEPIMVALSFIEKDPKFDQFSPKEKHLTFLFVVLQLVIEQQDFYKPFFKKNKTDLRLIADLLGSADQIEIPWEAEINWDLPLLNKVIDKTYRRALLQHTYSVFSFWSTDDSEESNDTEAYIEKSTDLLFNITDLKTLQSIVDFTKFMWSRKTKDLTIFKQES